MPCAHDSRQRQVEQLARLVPHARLVLLERLFRLGVDHRPDIGRVVERIADDELARRAEQHVDHAPRHVLLEEQHAQRRAALAGAVEGRRQRVVDHLLRQRGGIDDHAILAAGLGNQPDERPVTRGERAVDGDAGVGAAGEGDAVDARIADQRGADRLAALREGDAAHPAARPRHGDASRRGRR